MKFFQAQFRDAENGIRRGTMPAVSYSEFSRTTIMVF